MSEAGRTTTSIRNLPSGFGCLLFVLSTFLIPGGLPEFPGHDALDIDPDVHVSQGWFHRCDIHAHEVGKTGPEVCDFVTANNDHGFYYVDVA